MTHEGNPLLRQAQARIGAMLVGKWRLDTLIGVGGMAAVYAATHRNGNRVAVKMLHTQLSADDSLRARFLREGYVANAVEHEGAVRVLDDDIAKDGSVFLVMELLEGETLRGLWDRQGKRVQPALACRVADQLLDVLAAAHERGIVHRDLKPDNIFVTLPGAIKVLDFGLARLQELSVGDAATRTGSMLGTPAFMPPEQALGRTREIDNRTDLWSLGATMFTLLSGDLVHKGDTANEQLVSAATRPPRSLAEVAPQVPDDLVAWVDRALSFERAERWPDARTMQNALRVVMSSLPQSDLATAPTMISEPPTVPMPTVRTGPPPSSEHTTLPNPASHPVALSAPEAYGPTLQDPASQRVPASGALGPMSGPVSAMSSQSAYGRTVAEPPPRSSRLPILLGVSLGVVGLLAGVVVAGAGWISAHWPPRAPESSAPGGSFIVPSASPVSTSPPSASASAKAEPAKLGTLSVTAEGGLCEVNVSGVGRGRTPLNALEVRAGEHIVTCAVATGATFSRTVQVRPGETARAHFVLGSSPPPKKSDDPLDEWK